MAPLLTIVLSQHIRPVNHQQGATRLQGSSTSQSSLATAWGTMEQHTTRGAQLEPEGRRMHMNTATAGRAVPWWLPGTKGQLKSPEGQQHLVVDIMNACGIKGFRSRRKRDTSRQGVWQMCCVRTVQTALAAVVAAARVPSGPGCTAVCLPGDHSQTHQPQPRHLQEPCHAGH